MMPWLTSNAAWIPIFLAGVGSNEVPAAAVAAIRPASPKVIPVVTATEEEEGIQDASHNPIRIEHEVQVIANRPCPRRLNHPVM